MYVAGREPAVFRPVRPSMDLSKLDPQTVWMTIALIAVYFAVKFIIPRMMAGVPFTDPTAVQNRIAAGEDVVVLDVRTPNEFTGRMGHIPGSINVPLAELPRRLADGGADVEALKEAPVFVLCRANNRSPSAARVLRKRGFTNVQVIKGGIGAWARAKLPIETS